ncbi:leucine-rich repeat-containing protein 9-like [Folsomia candida]|uniref:leucine-rich repeat-containing protein 9-like n=1 Tax=Folsomia candida TaxID=158441 RepID=UPI001604E731|nr:leucine-rich repeat-containing protein 9-like [Folsomia candida]
MLNGKPVTDAERKELQLTISHKCLYYYADSVTCGSSYTARRKAVVQVAFKQLESLGDRIADLATFSAKCLQADYQMNGLPMFSKMQDQLMLDVSKIHTRLSHLKQWTRVVLRRIESLLRISRWEQQMDEWTKWLEFKSFGTIRAYISQSVTDLDSSKDEDDFRDTMHQLISALSCKKQWPRNTLLKLETIIVIQDRGAEAGMEKIFEDNYARKNEPKFIPPPPLEEDPVALATSLDIQHLLSGQPFYGPPSIQPIRVVPTYVDPNYKPPPPLFSYPESVPGLPERSQPLLLFLVTGSGACGTVKHNKDPLQYFHNLLFEKSRYFKEVRLTNCIWTATQLNYSQTNQAKSPKDASHSILFVVKVLEECLISVGKSNDCLMTSHNEDCMIFALRRPLCYSPAYIVYISHIPNDKKGNWYESVADDSDVTLGVSKMLEVISNRIVDLGAAQSRRNVPYYLHRTHDGVKADLTAVTKLLLLSTKHTDPLIKPTRNGAELLSVTKFLGPNILDTVTSLDLSANRLGLAVGLEGMISLKKLNLSYNNLTTLSGLHKLPQLKELKTGWNSLRFFHSNLNTLAWACSKLQVLEILPNPFQDVRDYGHIPVLANGYLPYLQRVDAWVAPFHPPSKCPISTSLELSCINANFSKEVLKFTWVGDNVTSMDYSGQCASNLDFLPPFPHQKETISSNRIGVLLNLSNNYITSSSLFTSSIVQNAEWRSFLVQLDLQENAVTNLGWMGNGLFPNLRIINMSNNQLSDLDALGFSCPNLEHLQISGNPIPCNFDVLQPLKYLKELMSLDASRTPIATHPEYSIYVRSNLTVQILDGVGLYLWNTMKAVGNKGGIMSHDWLETSLGPQNWNSLTELSLPHCDLHKVEFPSHSLPNLLSLDLTGNCLHTLAGLSVLLKLRVLCVSNNRIKSLGDPCPCCFEKMLEAQGGAIKNSASVESSKTSLPRSMSQKHHQSLIRGDGGNGTIATQLGGVMVRQDIQKTLFPNLEVLVLSHNAISSIENLHLHALPTLRTVILNCNKIKGFEGLDSLSTLKALVLDNNHITHIPFSSMKGCNSLKNLHLEHNRISVLPRLSNLHNLSALHIGYNRIQVRESINNIENVFIIILLVYV